MLTFRHRSAGIAVLALAGAVAAGCSSASPAATTDSAGSAGSAGSGHCATVRVGTVSFEPGVTTGLQGWGKDKNLWTADLKAAGICSVNWQTFEGGPLLNAALIGGSVDIAIMGDTPAVIAKSGGAATRLVNQYEVGMDTWVFAKPGITSLAGLKGGSVGVLPGGYLYRAILGMLGEKGLSSQVKVTTVSADAQGIAAVKSGSVDAYAGQPSKALLDSGLTVIAKASSKQFTNVLGTGVTLVTSDFLKAHPDLPAAWNKAQAAVLANAKAHATAYYAWDAKAFGDTPSLLGETQPLSLYSSEPFTSKGLELLGTLNQFLLKQKLSKGLVNINSWKVKNPS
jgi:sulfonate transport system substrate-binding protein